MPMKTIANDSAALPPALPLEPDPAASSERTAFAAKLGAILNAVPAEADGDGGGAADAKRGAFFSRAFFGGKAKAQTVLPPPEKTTVLETLQPLAPPAGDVHQGSAARIETPEPPEKPVLAVPVEPAPFLDPTPPPPSADVDMGAAVDAPPSLPEPTLDSSLAVPPSVPVNAAPAAPAENTPPEPFASPTAAVAPMAPPITHPEPAASIQPTQITMSSNAPSTALAANGQALAQLTFGFEIVAMQLTPSFRLGSVQLKASSDVVSLHLIAGQQDESPLAAGISFQVEHVELDDTAGIKFLLLKPLAESRELTAPRSTLQIGHVSIASNGEEAPISLKTADETATAVQLLGTFVVTGMDFTPAFEIGSLRLEPASRTVLLRVAHSNRPAALDLPPSFDLAAAELGADAKLSGVRVVPSANKPG